MTQLPGLHTGAGTAPADRADWSKRVQTDLSTRLSVGVDDVGAVARSAEVADMPGVEHAGALWASGDAVTASTATDPVPHALDRLQAVLRQGPAMVALRIRFPVVVLDFGTDGRWPALSAHALSHGVRGVICHPLRLPGDHAGVLTLYSGADGFSRSDLTCPSLFAVLAEIALRLSAEEAARECSGVLTHGTAAPGPADSAVRVRLQSSSDLLTVVRLSGEIDHATAPGLRTALLALPARRTVLDLSDVAFLSVAGLLVLIDLHRHLRSSGVRLHLAAPSVSVRRLIAIAASAPQVSRVLAAEFRAWADSP